MRKTWIGKIMLFACCLLMCTSITYAAGDDTDGTELQVAQPVVLQIQLGHEYPAAIRRVRLYNADSFKTRLASNGLGQSFSSKRMPVYIPERSRWDKTVFSAQNWAAAGPIFYHV